MSKRAISIKYPTFNVLEENPYQEEMDKMLGVSLSEASTTRTIKNITECLTKALKSKYGIKDKEELKKAVHDILHLHGMSPEHFDPLAMVSKLTFGSDKNVNNISVDDNANKSSVNMEGIQGESFLPYKKVIGYDFLYQILKEMYGKDEAKKCCASMYDFSLALNDSTRITMPYCYCIDASKLVKVGRNFGQVHSSPAKRIDTYISILGDTIREISFNIAGACLHHSQGLLMLENGVLKHKNIKELIESQPLNCNYLNYQGDWEYADISNLDLKVMEDGRFVKVNKIMRRKYADDIYVIKTKSGKTVKCSKDHIFKVLYKNRDLEVKAKDLQLYDTVYNTMLTTTLPIDKESDDYKRGQYIGMLCGDGCITAPYETRLAVNNEQMYIYEAFKNYNKEYYGKETYLYPDNRGKVGDAKVCSVDVHNDVKKDIIGEKALDKHIDITDKNMNYLCGFLDGLLVTDGCYNKSIGLASISKELVQNVYDICKMLNISCTEIRAYDDKRIENKRNTVYNINISLKLLPYLQLFEKKAQSNKKFVGKRVDEVAYFGYAAFKNSNNMVNGSKCKTYKARELAIHEPVTDVIVSIEIEKNDDDYVYEIETESHWYSVNGILTHNCAIGSLFLDVAHLAIYKERITLEDLKTDKKTRKYVTNCFQKLIHTVNHYSRNAIESPFTNVSLFDSVKLDSLIGDDNYGWYFPKKAAVIEDNNLKDSEEAYKQFIKDYIEELQEIYIDIFDAGDPLRNGLQFPYPVSTCNIAITTDEAGNRVLADTNNRLFDYITGKDISKYNIYCSEGTKVASCCFKGDEIIKVVNEDNVETAVSIKDFVKAYSTKLEDGNKVEDKLYIKSFNMVDNAEEKSLITGVLEKENKYGALIEIIVDGNTINVTPDHILMVKDKETGELKEVRAEDLPDNCLLPIYDNGIKWIEVSSFRKYSDNENVYDIELEKNHYFSANNIITHNCRLLSDADMMSLGEGVNSFGGSQISLGSHRVVTMDLYRIALEAESYDDFKKIVTERIEESAKILQAHRVLIHKLEQLGTQPWITNGWINMSHMFSTFGCVGYVEADKLLKDKFNHRDFDYMKDFLIYFNKECKRISEEYKMIWNIEAIPAEGMAPKLAKADKIIFANDDGNYEYNDEEFEMPDILANQWCSLWEDHSIYEKMKRDGEINSLITGGSIVHINVDSKITKTQAKKLIQDAIKYGMAHFALNAVYIECKDCGHVVKGYLDKCPNCGSEHLNHYSRVIGYFSKVEGWGKVRREKDFPNRKFLKATDIQNELGE